MPGAAGAPVWVGINTALPNRLVRATIEAGLLEPWLGPVAGIRAEVAYGANRRSRIDLLLTPAPEAPDQRPISALSRCLRSSSPSSSDGGRWWSEARIQVRLQPSENSAQNRKNPTV